MTCVAPRVVLNVGRTATPPTDCTPPASSRYVDYFRSTTPEPEVCTTYVTWRCRTAADSRLTGPGPTITWLTWPSCWPWPPLTMTTTMTSLMMTSSGRQRLGGSGTSTVVGRRNFRRHIRPGDLTQLGSAQWGIRRARDCQVGRRYGRLRACHDWRRRPTASSPRARWVDCARAS